MYAASGGSTALPIVLISFPLFSQVAGLVRATARGFQIRAISLSLSLVGAVGVHLALVAAAVGAGRAGKRAAVAHEVGAGRACKRAAVAHEEVGVAPDRPAVRIDALVRQVATVQCQCPSRQEALWLEVRRGKVMSFVSKMMN